MSGLSYDPRHLRVVPRMEPKLGLSESRAFSGAWCLSELRNWPHGREK